MKQKDLTNYTTEMKTIQTVYMPVDLFTRLDTESKKEKLSRNKLAVKLIGEALLSREETQK